MRRPLPVSAPLAAPADGPGALPPMATALALLASQNAGLAGLALGVQRAEELAAELGQFAAAMAAVRARLRFDSEPADWDVSCARWQQERQ